MFHATESKRLSFNLLAIAIGAALSTGAAAETVVGTNVFGQGATDNSTPATNIDFRIDLDT